ncbi:thioredoxin-like protein [Corynascus novoguineensis]|uniref:Thioredoxin-like protein n=1 Tax=Corynascus novoguineensis TaxID=1126955 RepID=A0AAN7CQK5_9PEZI|nr:thioredoxin-like protein [Corynascus novoguineensis]
MGSQDKLVLYTNHFCPWAHRAHIALAELGIPYEEVIIDLSVPRTPEYLQINPRGLVPSLSFNGEIITESAIVAQFLADQYPSHLVPPSNAPGGALRRARISFFVDAYISKVNSVLFGLYGAKTEEDQKAVGDKAVAALVKEVEPLLVDASPFFGGSDKLTLAEVLTGSFVLRLKALTAANVYPKAIWTAIEEQAPKFAKWAEAVTAHPSVTSIWDEKSNIERTIERLAKLRANA